MYCVWWKQPQEATRLEVSPYSFPEKPALATASGIIKAVATVPVPASCYSTLECQ